MNVKIFQNDYERCQINGNVDVLKTCRAFNDRDAMKE